MIQSLKKTFILLTAVISIVLAGSSPLFADQNTVYLQQIAANTLGTLQTLANYVTNWLTQLGGKDDSATPTLQQNFALIGQSLGSNFTSGTPQFATQIKILLDLFNPPPPGQTAVSPAPNITTTAKNIPNFNSLSYISLLGYPPAPKASDAGTAAYNYVKNASGATIPHTKPPSAGGSAADIQRYANMYNTVMAAESFGGFVLGQQLNGSQFSQAQTALINQVSSSNWSQQVSSEELGMVIRHILLFQSQMYVLLSDLITTQNQMLQAQVMTNALLILSNQNAEGLMLNRAQGINPQP